MRQINVGVVGLGWFGEKHCEVLSGLPEAKLAAEQSAATNQAVFL